jgi:hypothetical protein
MPKNPNRNYKKETAYEDQPDQVARRVARNKARKAAIKKHGKAALRGKEVDHKGSHRTGSLDNVPTRIVDKTTNRKKQPKRGKG